MILCLKEFDNMSPNNLEYYKERLEAQSTGRVKPPKIKNKDTDAEGGLSAAKVVRRIFLCLFTLIFCAAATLYTAEIGRAHV